MTYDMKVTVHQLTGQRRLEGDGPAVVAALAVDGVTSDDGRPCSALSRSRGNQCPKASVVVLMATPPPHVALCGSHYGVHREGHPLLLMDR